MTPSKAHPPRFHIYLDAEPDNYSGVLALRAFRAMRHHGFRDTTEYLSTIEHEALLCEARAEAFREAAKHIDPIRLMPTAKHFMKLAEAAAQAPGAVKEGE
jgi:hypothetical protein